MMMWWKSAVNRSFFLSLATFRMRSSACDTLIRLCARHVLCWSAFPSVSALGSTGSAVAGSATDCSTAGRSTLFAGFQASNLVHHRRHIPEDVHEVDAITKERPRLHHLAKRTYRRGAAVQQQAHNGRAIAQGERACRNHDWLARPLIHRHQGSRIGPRLPDGLPQPPPPP